MAGRKKKGRGPVKTLIRAKDTVQVISGRDGGRVTPPGEKERDTARSQGRRGRVRVVNRLKGTLLVDGVNIVHRHERPNPQKGHRGGRVDKEAPLAISAVRLVCPGCDRAVRVKAGRDEKGKVVRVCRKCDAQF
ncbi:MAG: 50S ribosomal protein L24 [Planctomycetota bacterium]|jgi:large subunit ribosomal protein L24